MFDVSQYAYLLQYVEYLRYVEWVVRMMSNVLLFMVTAPIIVLGAIEAVTYTMGLAVDTFVKFVFRRLVAQIQNIWVTVYLRINNDMFGARFNVNYRLAHKSVSRLIKRE